MRNRRVIHARVAGRLFRITTGEPFTSTGDEYMPVDCRDVASRIEAQAIVATDTYPLLSDPQICDAIASAYMNATKEILSPAQRRAIRPEASDAVYLSRWQVGGRNGYWPVDEYRPDSPDPSTIFGDSLILPRISERDAERIASALNHAFRLGAIYGAANGKV